MIGVLFKPEQRPVVEEFFELFKTPWAAYEDGRSYDVVVSTIGDVPDPARYGLVVLYGGSIQTCDERYGFTPISALTGRSVRSGSQQIPIYGELVAFAGSSSGRPCLSSEAGASGLRLEATKGRIVRLGYDLFDEVRTLLLKGQPVEHAHVPTLDLHIDLLRQQILDAGVELVEVLPVPSGHPFIVCLTHDIDFIGIRDHFFDHSMWGFLYRSTVGAVRGLISGRLSFARLLSMWRAAISLPFVYLGWVKDFWEPFEWYLQVEKGLPATYFLIPFKGQPGDRVPSPTASRRATAYDVTDIPAWTSTLQQEGCELGVHGIDAWHSVDKGRQELGRIADVTSTRDIGIRMHWLLTDENAARTLEAAGYAYDSTNGYNETIGYRSGTSQVFRPLDVRRLLELPMHIQDGALFYSQRLNLSEGDAWKRCAGVIEHGRRAGGVVTLLWHDRSHGPERFWGDFYKRLVASLKSSGAWFASAAQVVGWFRARRDISFEHLSSDTVLGVRLTSAGPIQPPLCIRVHQIATNRARAAVVDITWDGSSPLDSTAWARAASPLAS